MIIKHFLADGTEVILDTDKPYDRAYWERLQAEKRAEQEEVARQEALERKRFEARRLAIHKETTEWIQKGQKRIEERRKGRPIELQKSSFEEWWDKLWGLIGL